VLVHTSVVTLLNGFIRCSVSLRTISRLACTTCAAIALGFLSWGNTAYAQSPYHDLLGPISAPIPPSLSLPPSSSQQDFDSDEPSRPSSVTTSLDANSLGSVAEVKQSKRILWIFPNYRAVSADTQLPPLSFKDKFWLATEDSFDYSSFVSAGLYAGISQANKSYPEFGQGAKGYGRYYWHALTDQAVGNYMTEAILPVVTHEDPRYYTLGHRGFFKRTGYAVSRLLITRTDAGGRTFNFSEIVGNGAGAGISDAYYPSRERTWTKTYQKWGTQIALDGVFNIAKEFWPNINRSIFHGKY
jgi:hypothetical protein